MTFDEGLYLRSTLQYHPNDFLDRNSTEHLQWRENSLQYRQNHHDNRKYRICLEVETEGALFRSRY